MKFAFLTHVSRTLPPAALIWLVLTGDAHAMHISEGILPLDWALIWSAPAAIALLLSIAALKKKASVDISFKPFVGLITAVVFIISAMPIPVPTAGTCSHPCGTAMSAVLLGPLVSSLVAAVALLIQALFMAHGGLTTWGANIVSMGIVGSFAGYAVFRGLRFMGAGLGASGFAAGILADWATYAMTSFELALGIRGEDSLLPLFAKIFIAFVPTQLPLGIVEGAITAGIVVLLSRKRPDLLVKMRVLRPEEAAA